MISINESVPEERLSEHPLGVGTGARAVLVEDHHYKACKYEGGAYEEKWRKVDVFVE